MKLLTNSEYLVRDTVDLLSYLKPLRLRFHKSALRSLRKLMICILPVLAFTFLILQMVNKIIFFFHQLLYFALQRFNLLLVLLKADLIDQSIYLFFLLLRGIMNDWLRIYQILIFFNDLLLNLMYFFVLGKSHLRLFFQHLYEFIVHYH